MSENKPPVTETVDEFKEKIEKAADFETMKQDTAAKQAIINNKRATAQLENITQNERELAITKNSNFGALTKERVSELQNENDEYIKAAKSSMTFMNDTFMDVVPFFRKNFILIGGKTGDGKSTTVANIVHSILTQKKADGSTRRVLVLTNEERAEDFYNRVTCLINGWHYVNHSKFTTEMQDTFRKFIPILASNGRLTVIDNNHEGSYGVTTTIEGIETIFENLLKNGEYYDAILIDYYQNIISSKNDPSMKENDVQARLSRMMDKYKNIYPAPIVMMMQVNPVTEKDKLPFQQRIKGRKIIMDPATFVMEMIADRANLRTIWTPWKSRFTEAIGTDLFTGYDQGKYVAWTNEFAEKVQKIAYERQARMADRAIGIRDVNFDKDKKEEKKDE